MVAERACQCAGVAVDGQHCTVHVVLGEGVQSRDGEGHRGRTSEIIRTLSGGEDHGCGGDTRAHREGGAVHRPSKDCRDVEGGRDGNVILVSNRCDRVNDGR